MMTDDTLTPAEALLTSEPVEDAGKAPETQPAAEESNHAALSNHSAEQDIEAEPDPAPEQPAEPVTAEAEAAEA